MTDQFIVGVCIIKIRSLSIYVNLLETFSTGVILLLITFTPFPIPNTATKYSFASFTFFFTLWLIKLQFHFFIGKYVWCKRFFKMATDSSGPETQWQRGRFHFFKYYRRPCTVMCSITKKVIVEKLADRNGMRPWISVIGQYSWIKDSPKRISRVKIPIRDHAQGRRSVCQLSFWYDAIRSDNLCDSTVKWSVTTVDSLSLLTVRFSCLLTIATIL